jgi:hypothetical protein
LEQRWVLPFDLVQNYAASLHLRGIDAGDHIVNANAASRPGFALAPAAEYNWSDSVGISSAWNFRPPVATPLPMRVYRKRYA